MRKKFTKSIAMLALAVSMAVTSVSPTFAATTSTTTSAVTVAAVENISKTVLSTSSVKLSWDKVSDAAGYEIYYKTVSGAPWTKLKTTRSTSYTASSLNTGTTYYYKVRAYKMVNGTKYNGACSDNISYVGGTPAQVKNVEVARNTSSGSITISWDKVSGATGYQIYRTVYGKDSWKKVKTISSGSTVSYTDSSASDTTKYSYKVRATYTKSSKTYTGAYSSKRNIRAVKIGTLSSASVSEKSSTSVKVSWSGSASKVTGYQIYRKTGSSGKWKRVKTVTSASTKSYTDSSVSAGKTYYYKVRPYRTVSENKYYGSFTSSKKITTSSAGTYLSVSSAYTQLNTFRTTSGVWYWNSDNKTKTYFNKSGYTTLSKLSKNSKLEAVAKKRAKELATSFSHTRPNGTSCLTLYPCSIAGENIAMGYTSVSSVMTAWKEASCSYSGQGHRRNMLSTKYNAVGIACYKVNGVCYWVMALGHM